MENGNIEPQGEKKTVCLAVNGRGVLKSGMEFGKDVLIREKLIILLRYADWKGRKIFDFYIRMPEFKEDFLHLAGNKKDIETYIKQASRRQMKHCILPGFPGRRDSVYLMVSYYDMPLYLSLLECNAMKKRKLALSPTTAGHYFSEGYAGGGKGTLLKLEKSAGQNLEKLKRKRQRPGGSAGGR